MAKKYNSPTEVTFQQWIKEGRGSGKGRDCKPWLTVRDVASQGRSHRVFGFKSQRTHHLFFDLERPRAIEKPELERRYWQQKDVP
ncbi:hypothetical protein [Salidesulfovibrio onnuriiensis]|uniref:hypothetical protein n=1 Tax=Salidesulfovibrio onnuriiensis TaxID=2583823 RepID=UPI001C9C4748|nr:hypothetical protein [Salidesulfovibrio onnuriiensis]